MAVGWRIFFNVCVCVSSYSFKCLFKGQREGLFLFSVFFRGRGEFCPVFFFPLPLRVEKGGHVERSTVTLFVVCMLVLEVSGALMSR